MPRRPRTPAEEEEDEEQVKEKHRPTGAGEDGVGGGAGSGESYPKAGFTIEAVDNFLSPKKIEKKKT